MGLRAWRWWPWSRARGGAPEPAPAAGLASAPAGPAQEQSASGLTLGEATELLDQLERQGAHILAVDVGPDARVSVRWLAAPGDPGASHPC
jgi:hypothetical protein